MPGKVVLGISSVCFSSVLAARQKTGVEQASSVSIVESLYSLLEGDTASHAFSVIQQEMTPGVEQDVDAALRAARVKIEEQVETKIKGAQEQARQRIDEAYGKYEEAANAYSQAKASADSADKAFFECVEQEQAQQEEFEAARKALQAAESEERQTCQAMRDIDDYRFQAAPAFKFECNVNMEADCPAKLAAFEKKVDEMESQAASSLQEETRKYEAMKAQCEAKKKEVAAAQTAVRSKQMAVGRQMQVCRGLEESRMPHICKAGKMLQAKCPLESKYKELLDLETTSEADRIREWQSSATMKCMLLKYADGGMDDAVGNDDLQACSGGGLGFDRLSLRQEDLNKFAEAGQCKTGPVTFFNGFTWHRYKGRVTKAPFTPEFILGGADPFAFCAGVGAPIGEQNLGGGGGDGPLAPPEPQFADGSVLHELAGFEDCGVTWATVPTKKAGAIDSKLQMGATLATWGCDRLKKAGQYGQLMVNGKAYAVVSC